VEDLRTRKEIEEHADEDDNRGNWYRGNWLMGERGIARLQLEVLLDIRDVSLDIRDLLKRLVNLHEPQLLLAPQTGQDEEVPF
jgi:hypothetical protein